MLQAAPGAGKTTRVPLALLDEPWLGGAKIVMLEPRRLAARAAAAYMARLLGEPVGETVGYRVRLDTRVGPKTRIEVVTEGILGRMLQDDPALEGTGLVIFDEFHERSIHADLGLALVLQTRSVLRDDLGILIMSATLDGGPVAALLGDAPIVTSQGREFPIETRYIPRKPEQRIEAQVAATVRSVVAREDGDVLVFLPGAGEIRRVASLLGDSALPPDVRVVPLHGTMPLDQQDVAIAASPRGRRKVVLATSLAETSLTIEGVRVVIDSGLMRVPRFSPATGMTRLETRRVSVASADQRRGRAGRTGPGIAYRLWVEHEAGHLVPFSSPEILEADLAPVALTLAEAGVAEPSDLAWLDVPPAAAYAQARELLTQLGALDANGMITAHGKRMAQLPMHPRLAHMVLAAPRDLTRLACEIASLLGERDVLRADSGTADADLRLRIEALRATGRDAGSSIHGLSIDRDAVRRAREQAREWQRVVARLSRDAPAEAPTQAGGGAELSLAREHDDIDAAGVLLALAYPDRIAQRRSTRSVPRGGLRVPAMGSISSGSDQAGRYLLRNGRGAAFPSPQALSTSPYIVVAELDDQRPEARIFLAAPVAIADLEPYVENDVVHEDVIEYDHATRAVTARRRSMLGAIPLADAPLPHANPVTLSVALLHAIQEAGAAQLPWPDDALRLRERMRFAALHEPGMPDVSDEALTASMEDWLAPHIVPLYRMDDIDRVNFVEALSELLGWKRRAALDEVAPTHVTVPSGSRIPIDYGNPDSPVLAVRLQEMFGCTDTPRIARGRVPLTLHLLSPARRPVQVTRDLANFWRTSYFDVRKDLRGRYPKHHWPDDPLAAEPTSRTKRRS